MDVALFATTALVGRFFLFAGSPNKSNNNNKKRTAVTTTTSTTITWSLLQEQNAATSSAIIEHYANNNNNNGQLLFTKLAAAEGTLTTKRDADDDAKLQVGIEYAKQKGVIDPTFVPDPYVQIDVLGKTPSQVANSILDHVQQHGKNKDKNNNSKDENNVIVIVGLSGTGKGTTVAVLRDLLTAQNHKVVTWSNGNIFRSVTLLAATWCQQQFGQEAPFDGEKALTKQNLASFMQMLTFDKVEDANGGGGGGGYDTRIQGLGLDLYVSQVQNTTLKIPAVSKNIPTVAQATQGEVILFAAKAVQRLSADGIFVLLEGREQTVNYVRTPHRFQLVLSDPTLIGKRRAAQRLMGAALDTLKKNSNGESTTTTTTPSDEQIQKALDTALEKMVKEIH